jgi:hypothetical protein
MRTLHCPTVKPIHEACKENKDKALQACTYLNSAEESQGDAVASSRATGALLMQVVHMRAATWVKLATRSTSQWTATTADCSPPLLAHARAFSRDYKGTISLGQEQH